jgi:predicted AlkP superfamily pyrophosphatase or phosphodiesterase
MSIKNSGKERIRKKFVVIKSTDHGIVILRNIWIKELFDGTKWHKSHISKKKPEEHY